MNDGGKEHINTEENNKSSKNDRSLEKKNSELGAESNDNLSADIPDEADVEEVIKKNASSNKAKHKYDDDIRTYAPSLV